VNTWLYHDLQTGFEKLYADTPAWVMEIAEKNGWVAERGDVPLCQ
jgi:hypothetical protein